MSQSRILSDDDLAAAEKLAERFEMDAKYPVNVAGSAGCIASRKRDAQRNADLLRRLIQVVVNA